MSIILITSFPSIEIPGEISVMSLRMEESVGSCSVDSICTSLDVEAAFEGIYSLYNSEDTLYVSATLEEYDAIPVGNWYGIPTSGKEDLFKKMERVRHNVWTQLI